MFPTRFDREQDLTILVPVNSAKTSIQNRMSGGGFAIAVIRTW